MTEHITQWIPAYYDGELHGARKQQIEAHLSQCAGCREELEQLGGLSALLQENPVMPVRTPVARFAAQVRLRLPQPKEPTWRKMLKTGWQAAPLGIVGAWAFIQAVLLVAVVITIIVQVDGASLTAISPDLTGLLIFRWPETALQTQVWPTIALDLGLLAIINLILTVIFAGLIVSWLAGWWAYRQHQGFMSIPKTVV